jgi:hypothetical protein
MVPIRDKLSQTFQAKLRSDMNSKHRLADSNDWRCTPLPSLDRGQWLAALPLLRPKKNDVVPVTHPCLPETRRV